jgi:hypothetical protein
MLASCAAILGVIALAVQCSSTYQPDPLRAACETLPANSRTQVVRTPAILIMEVDPLNPTSGTSTQGPPFPEDFCHECVDPLSRGFTIVEIHLRRTFAGFGDLRWSTYPTPHVCPDRIVVLSRIGTNPSRENACSSSHMSREQHATL